MLFMMNMGFPGGSVVKNIAESTGLASSEMMMGDINVHRILLPIII